MKSNFKVSEFQQTNNVSSLMESQMSVVAAPLSKRVAEDPDREIAQMELLTRLTEASIVIRSETDRIKSIGVSDRSVRLLRILSEAIEEQRIGFQSEKSK
jgi:hypothetical protein